MVYFFRIRILESRHQVVVSFGSTEGEQLERNFTFKKSTSSPVGVEGANRAVLEAIWGC